MIPNVIHYCWFGRGNKPKLAERCIESWRKYCPDYRIIEWNEDNFDIGMNPYTRMCHREKKYAFLSDYTRLVVVERYGGIYFDTDVELIRALDELREYPSYFGFEDSAHIATGLGFGAEASNPVVRTMLEEYQILLDGTHGTIGCPILNTRALEKHGLRLDGTRQSLTCAEILPAEYLNPYDDPTGRLHLTPHTYSIHWFGKSWMDKRTVFRSRLTRPLHRWLGKDRFRKRDGL